MNYINPFNQLSGIYRILNKINGNCYIGSSPNVEKRYKHHLSTLRHNSSRCSILQKAFNKYGEDNFEFQVILCCKPEYRLYYEQQLIRELNSQYNVFTNVSDSPLRQFTFTEQSKLKMSIAHKGKKLSEQHKHNISLANKGRVFSKESKDKIRKAKQNTTLSQETIKKMSEAKKGKPWSEKRRAAYLKKTYNEQIS